MVEEKDNKKETPKAEIIYEEWKPGKKKEKPKEKITLEELSEIMESVGKEKESMKEKLLVEKRKQIIKEVQREVREELGLPEQDEGAREKIDPDQLRFLKYLMKPKKSSDIRSAFKDLKGIYGILRNEIAVLPDQTWSLSKDGWKKMIRYDYRILEDCPDDAWEEFLTEERILYIENIRGQEVRKVDPNRLFEYVTKKILGHHFTFAESEYTYYYRDGVYLRVSKAMLKNMGYLILRDKIWRGVIDEMVERIRFTIVREQEEVKPPKDMLCVNNGILDMKAHTLSPHSPDCIFFNKVPITYAQNAKCPKIDAFVNKVFQYDEDRKAFYELCGYTLYKGNPLQRFFIMIGVANSGKSKAVELVVNFLGTGNSRAIPMHDLAQNRGYSQAEIFNIMLTYYGDISPGLIKDFSFIKCITGEDKINARSIYGKPFEFRYNGKALYSANQPPAFSEDNAAVWRRPIIFKFYNPIPKNERNPFIIEEISTPEEFSGLLNKALRHLKGLVEHKEFSNEMSEEETRDYYMSKADPVFVFHNEMLEFSSVDYIATRELYTAFLRFCIENGKVAPTKEKFLDRLSALSRGERGKGAHNLAVIRGIKWKNPPASLLSSNNKNSSSHVQKVIEVIKVSHIPKTPLYMIQKSFEKPNNPDNPDNPPSMENEENKESKEKTLEPNDIPRQQKIRQFILDQTEGEIHRDALIPNVMAHNKTWSREEIEYVIEKMLTEGLLFEPSPGMVQKV